MKLLSYSYLLLSIPCASVSGFLVVESPSFLSPIFDQISQIKSSFFPNSQYSVSKSSLYNEKRLIQTSAFEAPECMNEKQIIGLRKRGIRFMDITDNMDLGGVKILKNLDIEYPKTLSHQKTVNSMNELLSTDFTKEKLSVFTDFNTRYYDSDVGRDASLWLKDRIQNIIDDGKVQDWVSVSSFSHRFRQSSVIARFEGSGVNSSQILLVTAHLDSLNQWIPWFGRAPGADDNGSGTMTILDAFRVLVQNKFKPQRTVEFHWYAGEEGGLLGSQDIANSYRKKDVNMIGQLHFDMTGFSNGQNIFGLVADNVNPDLLSFTRLLVLEYSKLVPKEFKCGYGCSDHASWHKAGYRSAMGFECDTLTANKYVHSPSDTIDKLDFDHMLEFSKVAIAYCVEVGQ
ncbi:Leucine aminopeptidase 1 [Smittium mucronatum]|uniref:Peptide hydrolase n=1 Tax=Smittium mucronatum TaxID=133383 RepID=A0A1R0GWG0_9FUNG|nr:Leucine aminopeptidase 1 [Smittium mucronatum]